MAINIPVSIELGGTLGQLKKAQDGIKGIGTAAKGVSGQDLGESLRAQIVKANKELDNAVEKFGAFSNEVRAAGARVAGLKDRQKDLKLITDAFDPDAKFLSFSNAVRGVTGAFTALQGAQAIFGSESEDVARALAKVQGALALSQGINSILESKDAIKALGVQIASLFTIKQADIAATEGQVVATNAYKGALAATGIGLFVIALGALVVNWDKVSKALGGANEAQKSFNQNQKNYAEITKDAAKNSAEELSKLKILYSVTQDTSVALTTRNKAVDALQKLYPSYFANLSNEAILNGKAETAYKNVTASIIAKAKAEAGQKRIAEIFGTEDYQKASQAVSLVNQRLEQARKSGIGFAEALAAGLPGIAASFKPGTKQFEIFYKQYEQGLKNANKQSIDFVNNADAQANAIIGIYDAAAFVENNAPEIKVEPPKIKVLDPFFIELNRQIDELEKRKIQFPLLSAAIDIQINRLKQEYNTAISTEIPKAIEDAGKVKPIEVALPINVTIPEQSVKIPEIPVGFITSEIQKQIDDAQALINQSFTNLVTGSAEALGQALAEGGDPFKAVGNFFLTSLGQFAIDLGKQVVVFGNIFEALAQTIGKLGGVGKIAVGLALIAFGAAVKAAVAKNAKKQGFASGGFVSGPGSDTSDSIPARLSKGEYVVRARAVRKVGVKFLDELNQGGIDIRALTSLPSRALVNRAGNPYTGLDSGSRAIVNRGTPISAFSEGGLVLSSNYKALVNRSSGFDMPGIDLTPPGYRALVNRPLPDTPRVTNTQVSMSGETMGGAIPYIAETRVSGQDLKIILSRADRRYSNAT